MDRLTFEGNFCDISQCTAFPCLYENDCSQKQVWERLKQYEDTGLTPEQCANAKAIIEMAFDNDTEKVEHIAELLRADKDGRVVVLPCKIGDTVYRIQYIIEGHGDKGCVRLGVDALEFQLIWLSEWGKTIFATREEAEQALEEEKKGG